jgi:dienelactone hydrolase
MRLNRKQERKRVRWLNLILLIPAMVLMTLTGVSCSNEKDEEGEALKPAVQPPIDPESLETVLLEYEVDGVERTGRLVYYPDLIRAPILIMMHDERGFDEWFMNRAERYARIKPGCVVVCPDLSGISTSARDKVVTDNVDAATREAMQIVRYVDQPRMGVIGWSTGATHALTCARKLDLSMAILCYGELIPREEALLHVREPVLGIYGGKDPDLPMTEIVAFRNAMENLAGSFTANVWEDEGAEFMRSPADPENANEADWEIIEWIDRYLMMR